VKDRSAEEMVLSDQILLDPSDRCRVVSRPEVFEMRLRSGEKLLVLNTPQLDVGPARHVGNELPDAPMRVALAQFDESAPNGES
jgi:hypothetical protein